MPFPMHLLTGVQHSMRYQQSNLLSSLSSSRGPHRARVPTPVAAVVCLLFGYLLGLQNRPDPYPIDRSAFLSPPEAIHGTNDAPTSHSSSSSSLPATGHLSSLDDFAQDYLKGSGLLQSRPPQRPGKSGSSNYTVIPYQILSWYPRIVLYPNFLDNQTTDHIRRMAASQLQKSKLGVGSVATGATEQEVRTSMGAFLSSQNDSTGLLRSIEQRIASVTLIPPSHGEDFNVLRYQSGQHYHTHMDTFDSRALRKMDPEFGQRMATMIMYLNDVEEGGETVFKSEGKYGAARALANGDDDAIGCKDTDFRYKPRQGDAVLFYSLNPDLSVDPRALHGACPVKGTSEKWVMTKWMHDKPVTDWDGEENF